MSEEFFEVPILEKLRSVPKDYRTVVAIQCAADGTDADSLIRSDGFITNKTETGHRFIHVGYMMNEAAEEIERLKRERDEAYERAAQVCDALSSYDEYDPGESFAKAIRALKSGEPK